MNREEVETMIDYLNGAIIGFKLEPTKAAHSWLKSLEKYSKREVWAAIEHFIDNTDHKPTNRTIREFCERKRADLRRRDMTASGEKQKREASESFSCVPGKNRTEQVIFVRSERAAEKWRRGERDEYLEGLLARGRQYGFTHPGINYEEIKDQAVESDVLDSMAIAAGR
jgi:hypothetical protein